MTLSSTYLQFTEELDRLKESGNYRVLRNLIHDGNHVWSEGKRLFNLSSNDYLGIGATQFLLAKEAEDAGIRMNTGSSASPLSFPVGSCSSRLLTGNHSAYGKLESLLCGMYKSESALIFNSGYHANIGILPALTTKNDLILADKLVHASLIDGIRLSDAKCVRFPHNDIEFVERLLHKERHRYTNVYIVVESIYSMDGDVSPLKKLAELKKKHDCLLYVDEAHAIGTHGANGLGLCEQKNILEVTDILLGTFGKAVAGQGAYAITNGIIREYLINRCRSLIFTTALPQQSIEWVYEVMKIIPTLTEKRKQLAEVSKQLKEGINLMGWKSKGETHIVPLITGDITMAVKISEYLAENGYLALPIRRPTVPEGNERIRFSLTANTTIKQINEILSLCKHIGLQTTATG